MEARSVSAGKAVVVAVVLAASVVSWPVGSFEVSRTISPAVAANPIEIVIWVMPGVTPENLERSLGLIEQGLGFWEAVPTSGIRFDIVEVTESAEEPAKQPHQLRIILANGDDLESGGASLPDRDGNPGTWFGAVADVPTLRLAEVTAHEIGHTLGFLHSTISVEFPLEQRPIMHFAISGDSLTQDDIAMIATTYPNPTGPPLDQVTATIRGRIVDAGTGLAIDGVNVVAVDFATGAPSVARISGAAGAPGTFELVGLPAGSHTLRFLDAYSYRGSYLGLGSGLAGGYQVDNFTPIETEAMSTAAGANADLGDVAIAIAPLSIAGVYVGSGTALGDARSWPPVGSALPSTEREPYEIWLHVVGGVRDLSGAVTGLPLGLTGTVRLAPRSPNEGIHGQHFIHVDGFPQQAGTFPVGIEITDLDGATEAFGFELEVSAACPPADRDGDGIVDCDDVCLDTDGDGYGEIGGAFGGTCLGTDCADDDPATFQGAQETNDGVDNQCPGDPGYRLIDETSGESGFRTPGDRETYSWPPQSGATLYEVARSATPDFMADCLRQSTSTTFFVDAEIPAPGAALFYLNRPLLPNPGSWGRGSFGERDLDCGTATPPISLVGLPRGPQLGRAEIPHGIGQ